MAEQSIQFTVAAKDKATRVAERAERALSKLQEQHYDATHSRREVEVRRVTSYYDKLATKYEGDARFKEQIAETSAARLAAINKKWDEREAGGKGGMSFSNLIPTIGAATAAVGAIRMAAGGIGVAFAEAKMHQAAMKGDAVEIMKAQLGVKDATEDMVRSIPILGSAISSAMRRFGDREGIEQAIKNIEEVKAATKQAEELARQWHKETALINARVSGATESEMARITGAQSEEARRSQITAMRQERIKIAQTVSDMEKKLQKDREALPKQQSAAAGLSGVIPGFSGVVNLFGKKPGDIEADSAALEDAKRKYTKIQAAIAELEKENVARVTADKAAADKKEIDEEKRKAEEIEANRRKAEQAALGKASAIYEPMSADMGEQRSFRFLRSAPGMADPEWATKQIKLAEDQKALLIEIAKNVGVKVEQVEVKI